MSQAGIVDIENSHPQLPTAFVTNSGTAIPIANTLEILGTAVAAHSIPLETTASGNTVTIEVQYASAAASSVANNAGVASFNSADFTVDANGYVSISGGMGFVESVSGTPNRITSTGGQNPIIDISASYVGQTSITTLGTVTSGTWNASLIPVAYGGTAAASFTAYAPICGGTTTTGVLQSASTGLSTSGFVLTSNGSSALPSFQSPSASGAIITITGNSGGAESPSAGNFNILGTGSITVAGSANTETVQLTGLTNHNVLVGAGSATITNVAPSATSGVPLISQGASSDPAFGTAVVAGGGTGVVTMTTAYAPVCAGTTATGPLQVASTGLGTSGFVLTSTGSSSLPTFQAIPSGALPWTAVTAATQTIAVNNAYIANRVGAVTFTLPASATIGDIFRIVDINQGFIIAQNANQKISMITTSTTVGITGSLVTVDVPGAAIECVASNTSASTVWLVISSMGNFTIN